jgi:hypothetical protein
VNLFNDRPTRGAREIAIAGALSLSFSLGGCADDTSPIDPDADGDAGNPCEYYGNCYSDEGYVDEGYVDEGYVDEGYVDEGWQEYSESFEEGWPPDEGYYTGPDPTVTDSNPTITDGTDSWTTLTTDTMMTTGSSGDTESTLGSTGSTGTGSTGETTGSTGETTGSTSEGSSGTDTDTDTGGVVVNFPPLGVFGDDVIEPDLVGTWSLQWTPDATTWDSVLTIDESGNFIWRETSADCASDTLATGALWVEPGQLVMHVETWDRQLPWDTLAIAGQEFPPPFRMRMSYALLGPNLGLAATERVVEAEPYAGRSYLQTIPEGKFIAGEWIGEAELLAAFDGETEPKVIVRDRWIADLDVEPGDVPENTGIVVHDQIYWGLDPPVASPTIFEGGNWTCLDGCPQPAGATLINGGNLYAYGPYAGFQRLMTFMSGRSFKRDLDTDCP